MPLALCLLFFGSAFNLRRDFGPFEQLLDLLKLVTLKVGLRAFCIMRWLYILHLDNRKGVLGTRWGGGTQDSAEGPGQKIMVWV